MAGWGELLKGVCEAGSPMATVLANPKVILDVGKGLAKGALYTGLGCYAGWKFFVKDEGADEIAVGFLGDKAKENYKQNGVLGLLKGKAAGNDAVNQSVGEIAVDGVLGNGTFNKSVDTVGKVVDGTSDVVSSVVDGAGNVLNSVGNGIKDVYHGVGDAATTLTSGGGVQQPQLTEAQLYQLYQQQALQQQPQGGGLLSALTPFSSVGNMVDQGLGSILKGGTGLSLAAMIPAAFLLFGNFGWFGKLSSLLLGTLAYKNMRQQQVLSTPLPHVMEQQVQQGSDYVQRNGFQYAVDTVQPEESNVIHRSRGI